jgi:hypothetical protein
MLLKIEKSVNGFSFLDNTLDIGSLFRVIELIFGLLVTGGIDHIINFFIGNFDIKIGGDAV